MSRIFLRSMHMAKYVNRSSIIVKNNLPPVFACRHSSGWIGTMADLNMDEDKGYATLVMKNPRGNALATPLIEEMSKAVTEVEKSKCHGLVLTSSVDNVFSYGLNLYEFGDPDSDVDSALKEQSYKYYCSFQDIWYKFFKSPLVTVAAMNGPAIAGGCALAMACDYRIASATPMFAIGMTEVSFGIEVPYFLLDALILIMGWNNGSKAALSAKLHSADEALRVGLVDELCSPDKMNVRIEKVMADYLKVNQKAQQGTKFDSHQEFMDRFEAMKEKDLSRVLASVTDPETRKLMFAYLESMT